jgi:hypothetical protein
MMKREQAVPTEGVLACFVARHILRPHRNPDLSVALELGRFLNGQPLRWRVTRDMLAWMA